VTATPDEHLDQARRNRALAEQMLHDHGDDPTYVQWAYDLLEQRSRAARYELARFDSAIVRQRLIGNYLAKITTFAGL
jgi:hypothetical protein